MIDALHLALSHGSRVFGAGDVHEAPEVSGLDILFEVGQVYTTNGGFKIPRIVRVGKTTNLRVRINQHYTGNIGDSVFRHHVFTALSNLHLPSTEDDITSYISQKFTFTYIAGEMAASLKGPICSLLFNNARFNNTDDWMGLHASLSKLWQSNNLNGPVLAEYGFIDLMHSIG